MKASLHGPARGTFELLLALRGWKERIATLLKDQRLVSMRAEVAKAARSQWSWATAGEAYETALRAVCRLKP